MGLLNWDNYSEEASSQPTTKTIPSMQVPNQTVIATKTIAPPPTVDAEITVATGLEIRTNPDQRRRIHVDEKRMINCHADLNQLVPFKYNWAWEKYLAACANHWMPGEINMAADIALWKDPNGLTEDERLIIKRNLFSSQQPSLGSLPAHYQPRRPTIPAAPSL
jgi:ribonucleoside-diphosphate reductase beta chain